MTRKKKDFQDELHMSDAFASMVNQIILTMLPKKITVADISDCWCKGHTLTNLLRSVEDNGRLPYDHEFAEPLLQKRKI